MLNRFDKALLLLFVSLFPSIIFALQTSQLKTSGLLELNYVEVLNRTSYEIHYSDATGLPRMVKPNFYSEPFRVSGSFTRITYQDAKKEHGCIFEFYPSDHLDVMRVDRYPVDPEDTCGVAGSEEHVTLIVGKGM